MKRRLPSLCITAMPLFLLFLFLLLLANAQLAAEGVRRGLEACVHTLLPTLFPFLVLSELLVASQAGRMLGKWIGRPVRALLGLSEGGAACLLLGILCGFPTGTSVAVSLCERDEITPSEVRRLLLFANNPSAGFLVGAVGGALFGNSGAGAALFGIVWLSALLLGICLHICVGKAPCCSHIPDNGAKKGLSVRDLTTGVTRGFSGMLQVFAFVLFFSCISTCVAAILKDLSVSRGVAALLCGMLEMTAGISGAAATLPPYTAFRAAAFLAGFSGISVCLQLFSIAEKHRPRLLPYLLTRSIQGTLCLGLAELYLRVFSPVLTLPTSITAFAAGGMRSSLAPVSLAVIGLLVILLLFCQRRRYDNGI